VGFCQDRIEADVTYSAQNIDTNAEYLNGSMPGEPLDIWYAWSNVSKTQTLFYAFTSEEVNPPVKNFLGQHFQVENETEVFIGTVLLLIEVYNDTNDDGIPQANFTSGESEISYYLEVNSSVRYEPTPIQKILENEIPHYKWGFKYETIDAFLQHADEAGHTGAKVMLDHLTFNFDFYVVQNISYLKTGFNIGNITSIEPWGEEPSISLQNMSLSLLFSTVVRSSKPFAAYVNGEPYNSTTTAHPATETHNGQIAVELIKAYEFLFGENYNITNDEGTETFETRSEAAATSSVPTGAHSRLEWTLRHFEDYLNISEIFPLAEGIGGLVNMDYNVSTFLYRICYPVWEGQSIEHDPTYVAYLFSNIIIPEISLIILPVFLMAALLAAFTLRRTHTKSAHALANSEKDKLAIYRKRK
jgi:hypothetical protein